MTIDTVCIHFHNKQSKIWFEKNAKWLHARNASNQGSEWQQWPIINSICILVIVFLSCIKRTNDSEKLKWIQKDRVILASFLSPLSSLSLVTSLLHSKNLFSPILNQPFVVAFPRPLLKATSPSHKSYSTSYPSRNIQTLSHGCQTESVGSF